MDRPILRNSLPPCSGSVARCPCLSIPSGRSLVFAGRLYNTQCTQLLAGASGSYMMSAKLRVADHLRAESFSHAESFVKRVTSSYGVDYNAREKMADRLFAFVDLRDPFMPSGIAGEELPGPVMSMMLARHFDSLSLFHTPHTSTNALATEREVLKRNPGCRITRHELPISDPKDYSSLIAGLRAAVTLLIRRPAENRYVCVSSGTAEMRAVWFSLATEGVSPSGSCFALDFQRHRLAS